MTKNLDFSIFKYQHVERFGTDETEYLLDEPCLIVQPKIDGTNALVVYNPETKEVIPGNRERFLTVQNDNEGFARFIQENYEKFLKALEEIFVTFKFFTPFNLDYIVLCGEMTKNGTFLVDPKFLHKFFVFDVVAIIDNEKYYIQIEKVQDILDKHGISYVPSKIVPRKELSDVDAFLEANKEFSRYLMRPEFETGEGFVIKSYSGHENKYGRTVWGKILYPKPNSSIRTKCLTDDMYADILDNWFDEVFLEKEYLKYVSLYKDSNIFKFANLVSREFIKEEISNIVFKYKFPVIDFSKLNALLTKKAKDFYEQNSKEQNPQEKSLVLERKL